VNNREIIDLMTVCLARSVSPGDFIGVGLGTPIALVAALLARQICGDVHVLAGGAFDVDGAADVWLGSRDATRGKAVGYVSHFDSMEMAERQTMTVQFVRPAQIDSQGNLNTSRIGARSAPEVRFPGGLATADVPSVLPRVIAYHPKHRVRNLPETVSFVTGRGAGRVDARYPAAGVVRVVTDLGVIDFTAKSPTLRSVHPWSSLTEISDNTGFELSPVDEVEVTPPVSDTEASSLALVDPRRLRDAELPARVAG
jgi:glutaconate CoA-transferase subunit B